MARALTAVRRGGKAAKPGKAARRVAQRIAAFNAGRDPERLRMKYQAMRASAFAFLRGTCHLFYEALPASRLLDQAPAAWLCGDLHLQNFGSYKGDNRLVYFDINDLLDLKRALPSVLQSHVKRKQPKWRSEAHRVVALQRRVQAVSMAFLAPVSVAGRAFVLRGLQPAQDRVALSGADDSQQLEELMESMGKLVAWGHLRSSGRQGSASADQLIAYWSKRARVRRLIELARQCDVRVRRDWRAYCAAYDTGFFEDRALSEPKPPRSARKATSSRRSKGSHRFATAAGPR